MFWITTAVSCVLAAFAFVGIALLLFVGELTGELDLALLGICLALFLMGTGNINDLKSERTATKRYEYISKTVRANSDKLDSISRRQEELIALVEGSPDHASTANRFRRLPTTAQSPPTDHISGSVASPTPPCPPTAPPDTPCICRRGSSRGLLSPLLGPGPPTPLMPRWLLGMSCPPFLLPLGLSAMGAA